MTDRASQREERIPAVSKEPDADEPARRKPYVPPAVHCLGNIAELTLGSGGSNVDHGHELPSKNGIG